MPNEFLESIDVIGRNRTNETLESIDVIGNRKGSETLESIDVIGGGRGPVDGERLESIDVIGKLGKKTDPKHLKYPLSLNDPTGAFKNAVRFTVYSQDKATFADPGDTPTIRSVPDQYAFGVRNFPATGGSFLAAFGFRNSLVAGARVNIGQLTEDIIGIGVNGAEYFTGGIKANYGQRTSRLDSTITLYMPDTVVNQDKHDYQPISINQASGRAGLYAAGGLPVGSSSPLGRVEVFAELAGRAGIFGGRSTEALLAGLGYALNPFLEMTYGGTQPRTFQFQFRFAPRNYKEAEEVLRIIKTFRFHSHSESAGADGDSFSRGSGTRFLVPPDHFEIEFLRKTPAGDFKENLAMPRVSTCMLSTVNTNYAAQLDSFATFRDGKPVSISLDLEFIESVILTKNDIKKGY